MKVILLSCLIALCLADYSELIASKAIQLSTAIYKINKNNQQLNKCPDCYKQFEPIKQILGNQILAVIGVDKLLKSIIVVFRGSANTQNFITDADFFMVSYDDSKCKGCKLHKGFYDSYSLLVAQGLEKIINRALKSYQNYKIIFTGHSLGGAVAIIAAVKFRQNNKANNVEVYTLGQPRVGNKKYAEYTDSLIQDNYRIVYGKDIVPHKPAYISFYRHSGYEIWYQNGMKQNYKGCRGDSNYCSNSLGNFNSAFSVEDHGTKKYLELYSLKKTNQNIFNAFKENVQGKKLKKKLVQFESGQIILKKMWLDIQNDLFEAFEDL